MTVRAHTVPLRAQSSSGTLEPQVNLGIARLLERPPPLVRSDYGATRRAAEALVATRHAEHRPVPETESQARFAEHMLSMVLFILG